MNHNIVKRMIFGDQIFSCFENRGGTPQYFHNMLLDVLAKTRQFGVGIIQKKYGHIANKERFSKTHDFF